MTDAEIFLDAIGLSIDQEDLEDVRDMIHNYVVAKEAVIENLERKLRNRNNQPVRDSGFGGRV